MSRIAIIDDGVTYKVGDVVTVTRSDGLHTKKTTHGAISAIAGLYIILDVSSKFNSKIITIYIDEILSIRGSEESDEN